MWHKAPYEPELLQASVSLWFTFCNINGSVSTWECTGHVRWGRNPPEHCLWTSQCDQTSTGTNLPFWFDLFMRQLTKPLALLDKAKLEDFGCSTGFPRCNLHTHQFFLLSLWPCGSGVPQQHSDPCCPERVFTVWNKRHRCKNYCVYFASYTFLLVVTTAWLEISMTMAIMCYTTKKKKKNTPQDRENTLLVLVNNREGDNRTQLEQVK